MKTFFLFIALLLVVTLTSSSVTTATNAANPAVKEKAAIKFDYKVILMDIPLKGEYLFVHDDAAMARGEACTYVYKGLNEIPKNLVISFHCTPAERAKAGSFTVRTSHVSPGQYELREFQFAGSTEGHLVPVGQHAETRDHRADALSRQARHTTLRCCDLIGKQRGRGTSRSTKRGPTLLCADVTFVCADLCNTFFCSGLKPRMF